MNILVIEDNKETREFLESSLRGEGYVVDTAEDGEAGLEKALANDYDLVMLDNTLPKKNGRQVCSAIRKKGKSMPIMMLSVKSEVDDKVNLFEAGVDDYMTKPFSFEELTARIKALLRRPKIIEHEILQIGDLSLDCSGHTIRRGKEELHLQQKEFSLLEYLLRKKGVAVGRAEIMEHVWDMNADPFTNTIETHILNLRRKIGDKGQIIQTVKGVGYKIG